MRHAAATVCRTVLRQCTLALRLMRQEGSFIDTIEEQPEKATSPRLVRPAGSWQLNRRQLAGTKRRMALGGTWANLRMLSSKPAGSSIDVIEEQS